MLPHVNRPGTIVVGSDFKALGVVRSLGRRGIKSIVIDNTPRSAWYSRYVTRRIAWHGPLDDAAFLKFLLAIGEKYKLRGWLLLPTQDEAVELVARNAPHLAECYRLVTPGWEVVRWATDKRLTYQMAEEQGIPYPRTWYPKDEHELATIQFPFPVILKPAISVRLQYATRLKALPATNSTELLEHYRALTRIIAPDEIMVQEIIPGGGKTQFSVATYCKDGQILLHMTARRSRQYPIDYGLGSSFVEALEVPTISEHAAKLLSFMRVSGMVEVEFKQDTRDQQYKLLDINIRPWGWHTLCIACGLDFPYIEYCDTLGEKPPSLQPRYDYHWIRMITDLPAGLQEMRAGLTTPGAYIRSLLGKTDFSVLDWRDPLPVVWDSLSVLIRAVKGLRRRRE
ncbi:MAG: ATP-grasp domain-containing protein [Ktedonobacteraceae bacterium]|nr:ATP-grasp domain-containing protein [Ktedonobacteraceae bacterium]MBO0790102.1 ATP-grasp domain-containing protein [Ktedonobacteraceae bacterium]